jgi:phage terminase small subunit
VVKNPRAQVLRDLTAELFQLYAKFGLTPVDRARLRLHTAESAARDHIRELEDKYLTGGAG